MQFFSHPGISQDISFIWNKADTFQAYWARAVRTGVPGVEMTCSLKAIRWDAFKGLSNCLIGPGQGHVKQGKTIN